MPRTTIHLWPRGQFGGRVAEPPSKLQFATVDLNIGEEDDDTQLILFLRPDEFSAAADVFEAIGADLRALDPQDQNRRMKASIMEAVEGVPV